MAKSSVDQSSFLGGEWGPLSQGRHDDPRYATALALSLNGYPVEEGAWAKRSGTQFIVPSHGRTYAKLLPFEGSDTCSFCMEFTDDTLRLLTQNSLVCTNDPATITTNDGSGDLTLDSDPGWSPGDEIFLVFPDITSPLYPYPQALEANLRSRILTVGTYTPTGGFGVITLNDDLGNPINFTGWASGALVGAQVMHVMLITTAYAGVPQLSTLRAVQAEVNSIILSSSAPPSELQITTQGTLNADPVFTFGALNMVDGPYLDPQPMSATVSAVTGTVTLTAGSAAFAATDVGRSARLFTQPPLWNSSSTYSAGDNVTDASGAYWTAIASVPAGVVPGTAATIGGIATIVWAPAPTAATWAWGTISHYTNATTVTFVFDTTIPGMALIASNGTTLTEWSLGVYSGTTGYPTCGVFYEGRLWLGGAVLNRFDTTTSNGVSQIIGTNKAVFSPTDPNGNVLDDSGMSEVLNSSGINQIQWMLGDAGGVLMGTLHGETLVGASVLGDPITPTSIQAHEHTRYGSAVNIDAIRAGMAVLFVQKLGRRVIEYLDDAFSGKPSGRHLNEHSKHLTQSGVISLAYTEEPVPSVWALMANGLLAGCTYRRFSRFVQTPPEAAGWHWNMHGGNRAFTSMCTVPGTNGLQERLFVATNVQNSTPTGGGSSNFYIEVMQPLLEPGNATTAAQFLDQVGCLGPGKSGFDCGGMNASGFFPTGFFRGSDGSPSSGIPDSFAGFTAGQSPLWAGANLLAAKKTVYFPGSVILYNLPKYGSPTDETSMSMSVWVGSGDMPYQSGALVSSPALDFAQAFANTYTVSGMLGVGRSLGSGGTMLANSNSGTTDLNSTAEAVISESLAWSHVMISAKSDGTGNIVVTAAVNDTVVYSSSSFGSVGNNKDMWLFNSSQDRNQENGLSLWAIGGQMVTVPKFVLDIVNYVTPLVINTPPLTQLLKLGPGQSIGAAAYPIGMGVGATLADIYNSIYRGSSTVIEEVSSKLIGGSGGQSNMPVPDGLGGTSGFVGSVAELWIKPGSFIDWTSSTNRYKFHEYDSVANNWAPIPLGASGGTPGFGTPWVYLSGGPRQFVSNRATGTVLTEHDTTSGLINFDTGEGGGLQVSPLSWP